VDLTAAVGWLATLLGISFAWPQALRARRTNALSGISPLTQSLMLVTSASWVGYGVSIGDPIMIISNAIAGAAVAITAQVLLRHGHLEHRLLGAVAVAWALSLSVLLVLVGGVAAGIVGAALGTAMTLPQAAALRRGRVPEGVSFATYLLLAATMTCWLAYGALRGDVVVVAPNVVAVPVVLGVCLMLRRANQSSPDVAVADAGAVA
jgi:uncharacterized protein with PQ loop repeat